MATLSTWSGPPRSLRRPGELVVARRGSPQEARGENAGVESRVHLSRAAVRRVVPQIADAQRLRVGDAQLERRARRGGEVESRRDGIRDAPREPESAAARLHR